MRCEAFACGSNTQKLDEVQTKHFEMWIFQQHECEHSKETEKSHD